MYKIIRPILFLMSADLAHHVVAFFMKLATKARPILILLERLFLVKSSRITLTVDGVKYSNPIGMAAGFDKNAELTPFFNMLGFGFVEVGSITYSPSQGNPLPRMIRLKSGKALINRCGLNNYGAHIVKNHFAESDSRYPIGVNIAKSHDPNLLGVEGVKDFSLAFETLKNCGNYIALNISCPNTKEGKTFEGEKELDELLNAINPSSATKPVYLKLSPDMDQPLLASIIYIAEKHKVNGYIVGNTTQNRSFLRGSDAEVASEFGKGGLSGRPLKKNNMKTVKQIWNMTNGNKTIIACGGVENAHDVYQAIGSGASLVQLYTSLIYEGPFLIRRILKDLDQMLANDGLTVESLRGRLVI